MAKPRPSATSYNCFDHCRGISDQNGLKNFVGSFEWVIFININWSMSHFCFYVCLYDKEVNMNNPGCMTQMTKIMFLSHLTVHYLFDSSTLRYQFDLWIVYSTNNGPWLIIVTPIKENQVFVEKTKYAKTLSNLLPYSGKGSLPY